MLRYLSIENFALIDRLEVEFGHGLNLITGETGSGKSILVDAVGLLAGGRASQEMIRSGFDKSRVEGIFQLTPDHPVRSRLEAAGVEAIDQLIVRREISAAGANRVFVNNTLSTQGFLAEIGASLVDVHGQHDQQELLSPRSHLRFLDAFARHAELVESTVELYRRHQAAARQLETIRSGERERLRRIDDLRFQIQDIDQLRLEPGVDRQLTEEKRLLSSAEKRRRASELAYRKLYEDERSALARLDQVEKAVEELAGFDSAFAPTVQRLTEVRYQLEEIGYELRDYADSVEFNPARLEAVEERLAELGKAQRKYGDSVEDILAYREAIEKELSRLSDAETQMEALVEQRRRLGAEYLKAAQKLSASRRQSAQALSDRVESELADLAMTSTRFQAQLRSDPGEPTEKGIDRVEFLISPNPGEEPKPLARIASGGELSRIILALKSILTLEKHPKTLVFDEIDSGIGGRVASTLGEKLSRLALENQVFCVTHLPQIAAAAAHHFHVGKVRQGNRTRIQLEALRETAREQELARMLAGSRVTSTTLQQARELLDRRSDKTGKT